MNDADDKNTNPIESSFFCLLKTVVPESESVLRLRIRALAPKPACIPASASSSPLFFENCICNTALAVSSYFQLPENRGHDKSCPDCLKEPSYFRKANFDSVCKYWS